MVVAVDAEAGMDVPNFADMTRAGVLQHIAELEAAAQGSESVRLLREGL